MKSTIPPPIEDQPPDEFGDLNMELDIQEQILDVRKRRRNNSDHLSMYKELGDVKSNFTFVKSSVELENLASKKLNLR